MINSKDEIQAFLNSLLVYESGIDPLKFDSYVKNYNVNCIKYPSVESPGRIFRNKDTGDYELRNATIKEYFEAMGVGHLFDCDDRSCITKMQYRCINPWGFVGIQLGEKILTKTKYYIPKEKFNNSNESAFVIYTGDIPNSRWKNGNRYSQTNGKLLDKKIISSDVNEWKGRFTGLNSVVDMETFRSPKYQIVIFLDTMLNNINEICELSGEVENKLHKYFDSLNKRPFDLSGMLACTHLRGPGSTFQYLTKNEISKDELGTSIEKYYEKFSGFHFSVTDLKSFTSIAKEELVGLHRNT